MAPPHTNGSATDADALRGVSKEQRTAALQAAIKLYVGSIELSETMKREELAQLEGFQRVLALRNGVLCAAIRYVRQNPKADSTLAVLILIAFLCDNNDGLCRVGVARMAEIFGRSYDATSETIKRLEKAGMIGVLRPPGLEAAYWVKIPIEVAYVPAHAVDFVRALSSRPTPYYQRAFQPEAVEAPPVSRGGSTPGVKPAEPPVSTPDTLVCTKGTNSNLSLSVDQHSANADTTTHIDGEIISPKSRPAGTPKRRRAGAGKRPWDWVSESEKRELIEFAKEFAAQRGWTPDFLVQRLHAFNLHQRAHRCASADWQASLEAWLGNPNYQPRRPTSSRAAGASAYDIGLRAFGGEPCEHS